MKHNRHLVRYTVDNYADLAEGCSPLHTSLRSVSVSILESLWAYELFSRLPDTEHVLFWRRTPRLDNVKVET